MNLYVTVKALHIAMAATSVSFFTLRVAWAQWRPALLHNFWIRVLPHVVDTVFLASGLTLAALLHQYPFVDAWLTAKVLGLIGYIALGSVALKRAKTAPMRAAGLATALGLFAYIVGVAVTHDPRSWWVTGQ